MNLRKTITEAPPPLRGAPHPHSNSYGKDSVYSKRSQKENGAMGGDERGFYFSHFFMVWGFYLISTFFKSFAKKGKSL